jgi:hypothetical protein
MLIPKLIKHPLRDIELMEDANKQPLDNETKMLEKYIKLHDWYYDLDQHVKSLREKYTTHFYNFRITQKELFEIEYRIDRLIEEKKKLIPKFADYMTFREGYCKFLDYAAKYNEFYHAFESNSSELSAELEVIYEMNSRLFDADEEEDTLWDALDESETEFYDNYEKMCYDLVAYDDDIEKFREAVAVITMNKDELYEEINEYIADEYNPFMDNYNKVIDKASHLNDDMDDLHNAYLQYTKATEVEGQVIWTEWFDSGPFGDDFEFVDVGVTYDFEFVEDGKLLFHLDTQIILENILQQIYRGSYLMNCKQEEIFTREILEPLIGRNLEIMKNEIADANTEVGNRIDMKGIDIGYELIHDITGVFIDGITSQNINLFGDNGMNQPGLHIPKPGNNSLMALTMINVMDQLFFDNPAFDHPKNQQAFNRVANLCHYITLKNRLLKMFEGEVTLSMSQYFLFLAFMDCASQLLVGEHDQDFIEGLKTLKVDDEALKMYLKMSREHYKGALEHFDKNNITVTYLKHTRNWNSVFF